MFKVRLINQVRSQTPCAPPVTYIQDEIAIHDFNRDMINVSIGLAEDLTVDRIIGNIRVSISKYSTIIYEMHHSVTPELLTRKWVICLENAKETLKSTTQDCICLDLLLLTSIHRIYLISQHLSRLSCTF